MCVNVNECACMCVCVHVCECVYEYGVRVHVCKCAYACGVCVHMSVCECMRESVCVWCVVRVCVSVWTQIEGTWTHDIISFKNSGML